MSETGNNLIFRNCAVVLPDGILNDGAVAVRDGVIASVTNSAQNVGGVDLEGCYLAPGFLDLHVHGGDNADFMDGTEEAFQTVCAAHLRHGTTNLTPTTTVARHEQHLAFFDVCRRLMNDQSTPNRILGCHFYGPYFAEPARGCHPGESVRAPNESEYKQYLEFASIINRATVAPELPQAEAFVRACRAKKIRCNAGHTHATFDQMHDAIQWGVDHVDHLFCAMSDRARLRQTQTYPMRGGVMEATLFFDELTTEVIADGKHLSAELLQLAYKIKGRDRLALVTDCNRALDMPDGEYLFGPLDGGEPIIRRDGVGIMPDGSSLASGVVGLDECVRVFLELTGAALHDAIHMATLTPARIAGWDEHVGSIEVGKFADFVVLDKSLQVRQVYVGGNLKWSAETGT